MDLLGSTPSSIALEIRLSAARIVEKWKTYADDNNLKACEFRCGVEANDKGSLFYGCVREAFSERGFVIEHLVAYPIGLNQNKEVVRELCFFVYREEAPRILKA